MAGNIFGDLFRVVTFGESHGPAMGCVIDGCPAGLELSVDDIRQELVRRRPGQSSENCAGANCAAASSARNEADEPEILSGLFEGKTLGTPIAILVRNSDCKESEYENLRDVFRPGHADAGWQAKFGIRDHRGGGRSSGRETLCRVAAGAVAKKFLAGYGIHISSWVSAIAGQDVCLSADKAQPDNADVDAMLKTIRAEGDSAGGMVSCLVRGVPKGLGEPVFDKLDARLAGAMLSVGAVKGIEFGAGFAAACMKGSENNDAGMTNNAGGVLGGISTGQDIEFKTAFKPVPSIAQPQKALNANGGIVDLTINGRHDICIAPRAVPVVEAMTALVLADLVLLQRSNRISVLSEL
ncbi:MAG: chorismate synthase [Treponema sp.]|nr:chorismate synthase [Treponema sp.]